jgi:Protein of unknown function (DUF3467)
VNEESKLVSKPPTTIESAAFASIYTNHTNFQISPIDLRLTFGETKPRGEETVVELKTSVVMSLQHAKLLAIMLTENLANYEKHFGPIRVPQHPQT